MGAGILLSTRAKEREEVMATDLDELMLRLEEEGYHKASAEDIDAIIAAQRKHRNLSSTEVRTAKATAPKITLADIGLEPEIKIRRI
jgi:hypothetical protein